VANKKDQNFLFSLTADRPKISRLVVFVIGCAMTLVFAPAEWSILAPLLILPLLFVALTVSPKETGAHFFWFGFGLFLTGAVWIALLLMVGLSWIMAMFLGLVGWLMSRLSHGEPWRLLFVAPAAWVMVEWVRGWILTGFPWLSQGYGQIDGALAGWAPVFGIYGVSFMLLFGTAAILVLIMTTGMQRLIAAPLIRTTIIQAGVPQDQKWLTSQRQATLDFYRGSTLSVPDSLSGYRRWGCEAKRADRIAGDP